MNSQGDLSSLHQYIFHITAPSLTRDLSNQCGYSQRYIRNKCVNKLTLNHSFVMHRLYIRWRGPLLPALEINFLTPVKKNKCLEVCCIPTEVTMKKSENKMTGGWRHLWLITLLGSLLSAKSNILNGGRKDSSYAFLLVIVT